METTQPPVSRTVYDAKFLLNLKDRASDPSLIDWKLPPERGQKPFAGPIHIRKTDSEWTMTFARMQELACERLDILAADRRKEESVKLRKPNIQWHQVRLPWVPELEMSQIQHTISLLTEVWARIDDTASIHPFARTFGPSVHVTFRNWTSRLAGQICQTRQQYALSEPKGRVGSLISGRYMMYCLTQYEGKEFKHRFARVWQMYSSHPHVGHDRATRVMRNVIAGLSYSENDELKPPAVRQQAQAALVKLSTVLSCSRFAELKKYRDEPPASYYGYYQDLAVS